MGADRSVLHFACNPRTGVWSVMQQLAEWQLSQGWRVAFGLLLPYNWPTDHHRDLEKLRKAGIEAYLGPSPPLPGTLATAWHQAHNPLRRWSQIFGDFHSGPLAIHFHNAWLSGAYLPAGSKAALVATYHGIAAARLLRVQPVRRAIHAYWARRFARLGGKNGIG